MVNFADGLKFQKMKAEHEALKDQLVHVTAELVELTLDRELLVAALVGTEEFADWLLEQDLSSTMLEAKAKVAPGAMTEGQQDLELALQFARSLPG